MSGSAGTLPGNILITILSSHINAETPGAIHEGGELGYALAVSFGAVMDNPDLIVPCVIGDGEAEAGPTATFVLLIPYPSCSSDIHHLVRGMDSNTSTLKSLAPSFLSFISMASRSATARFLAAWITKSS